MRNRWAQKRAGFTIIELLIVVVVIAILAVIVTVAYNGIQQRATNTRFLAAIDIYEKALRMYYIDNNSYPETNANSVCLGGNYKAGNGFNQDACFANVTGVSATTSPTINQALQKYITSQPSVGDVIFYLSGQPYTRGVWYAGGDNAGAGQYAALSYYINGDQACGRGTKQTVIVSGTQLTVCQLIILNP